MNDLKQRNFKRNLRMVFMIVSGINQFFCAITSITNIIDNETFVIVYNIVSIILTGLSSALAFWYNNSFTDDAKLADDYMYALNQARVQDEWVQRNSVDHSNEIVLVDEEGE